MKMKKIAALLTAAAIAFQTCPAVVFAADEAPAVSENYTGKLEKDGKLYYYKNGVLLKNTWLSCRGRKIYYAKKDGTLAIGLLTVGGIEYEFGKNGKLIDDKKDVIMTVSDAAPTGLTLSIEPAVKDPLMLITTVDFYKLQRYSENKWNDLEYIGDDSWNDMSYVIWDSGSGFCMGNTSERCGYCDKRDWSKLYGTLTDGRYRLVKKIRTSEFNEDLSGEKHSLKEYYAYFYIKDGEAVSDGWANYTDGRKYLRMGKVVKNETFRDGDILYYSDSDGYALPAAVFTVIAPDKTRYESYNCGRTWYVDGKITNAPLIYLRSKEIFPVNLSEGFTAELYCGNDSGMMFGDIYSLDILENGKWHSAQYEDKTVEYGFTCIGYETEGSGGAAKKLSFDIYEKTAGRYRYTTDGSIWNENAANGGKYDDYTCIIEFTALAG